MVITQAGQALYAKVQTGATLTFTRMQIGSGQLSTTLTSALTQGTSYSAISVAALPRAVGNGDTITIGVGATSQNVIVSSAAPAGSTSISVVTFTANASYAIGTIVTDITDAASLSALIAPIGYFNINSEVTTGSTANIRGIFQNTNLTASTYTCEVGLFAEDPTAGEILYAYTNAGTLGDTFPPYSSGPFSRQFQISVAIGNASNVTANVPDMTYVPMTEVGSANGVASLDASGQVPASQLGNVPPVTATSIETALGFTPVANTPSAIESALGFTPLSTTGTAANSNQLGGQPASNYLRTDAAAPNPQTVANLVTFNGGFGGTGEIIQSTQTLTDQYLGGFVEFCGSSATTITLPNPTVNATGKTISFWNNSGYTLTLSTPSGAIYGPGGSSESTMTVPKGQLMTLISDGYNWVVLTGSTRNIFDDGSGNMTVAGTITSSSGQLGSASGTWTPASGSLNVAAGTVINVAAVPSGAIMASVQDTTGTSGSAYGGCTIFMTPSGAAGFSQRASSVSVTAWWANGVSSTSGTLFGSSVFFPTLLNDGSYSTAGYFQINNGYLQFVATQAASTNTGPKSTIRWAVA